MKLRKILNESLKDTKIIKRLNFELTQNDTGIECWNRLFKENGYSNKIKPHGSINSLIYRGFSKKTHLENFLDGNIRPMTGNNGTGVYFASDKSYATSYAGEGGLLTVNLNKKLIDQTKMNRDFIQILETNFEKQDALKLWNRFKDNGLMAMIMFEPGVVLMDKAIIINDFKILNLI